MAKFSRYSVFFLLLLILGGLTHCTNKKSEVVMNSNTPINQPIVDSSQLLLTFSTSDYDSSTFSLFVLGLVDIIATLKLPNQQVIEFSLYGVEYVSYPYYLPTTAINLSDPNDQHYHLLDNFQIPSGELHALTFIFSGSQSQIAQQGKNIRLVDSFSTPLGNTHSASDKTQATTLQTTLKLTSTINLINGNSFALNIIIDKALTAAISFTEPEQQSTAPLIPVMTIQDMTTKPASGIPLRIERKSTIYTNEKSLLIGHTPPLELSYSQEENSNIQFNNQRIKNVTQIKDGQYFIALDGIYQITNQHLSINNAQFFTLEEKNKKSIQKGRWLNNKEKKHFVGYAIPLNVVTDFISIKENETTLPINQDGNYITRFWDGIQHYPISDLQPKPFIESEVLLIQQNIQLTHPDLLSIKHAQEDDDKVSFQLPEPLSCHTVIFPAPDDCQSVSRYIENILLPLSIQGEFTLNLSRNGEITTSNNTLTVNTSADRNETYDNSADFYLALKETLIKGAYRVNSFSAEGMLTNNTFVIDGSVKVTLLAAQKPLDDAIDNYREQNPNILSPTHIALISAASLSAISLAALTIYKLISKKPSDLMIKTEYPYYKWQKAPYPRPYKWQDSPPELMFQKGEGESQVFQSPDLRNDPNIAWREPSIPTNNDNSDAIYDKNHPEKNKGGVTTWDIKQPASGQLKKVTPKPVAIDNSGGTSPQGITFYDGQQEITLKTVILKDRTLDLSKPENHPIFERGTGAYYFPKTQYQIDNGLPADTLFYPNYTNIKKYPNKFYDENIAPIEENMTFKIQLGENIKSILSNENIAIEPNILALLKTAEDASKAKEGEYKAQVEAANNKLRNQEIDIKTYGRLTIPPPSSRKNLIKK